MSSTENQTSPAENGRQPLWEHLDELRTRLIRVILASMVAGLVAYRYSDALVLWLEQPVLKSLPANQANLYFTGIADKFFAYVKISFIVGMCAVSPYLLWEIWGFISPALEKSERKFMLPFTVVGTLAFAIGLSFGYYVVLPTGYEFLVNFGSPVEKPLITIAEYFTLTLKLLLAMGLIFEVPVVMAILAKFGIIRAGILRKFRRHSIVANAIIAAVITPTPDAFTMLLVMIPLCLLYELGVIAVAWIEKSEDKRRASDDEPHDPSPPQSLGDGPVVGFPREPETL